MDRGGRVVTASEDFVGDVLIQGEQIVAIGSDLKRSIGVTGACEKSTRVAYS